MQVQEEPKTTDATSAPVTIADTLADQASRFLAQANKAGYEEQTGNIWVVDLNELYCTGRLWSALGPNPNSPYFAAALPPVAGQAPAKVGLIVARLREDEALVMIGITPPPMAYFSINFQMIRGVLKPPESPVLWIPVGDQINNQVIRTAGPTAFNAPFVVVVTGNGRTQREVHQMLQDAGLGDIINDQVIPSALFRMGLDADSDEFGLAMRTAVVPEGSRQAFAEYQQNPPIQIFRVRPKSANPTEPAYPPDPLPVPPLRVSGTGTTELDLTPTLELLRQRIIDKYPDYVAEDVRVEPTFGHAYPGLQLNKVTEPPARDGVFGASSDAFYLASSYFTLPDGAFVVAYGPNHRATGKASYASISVYADSVAWVGLTTIQDPELQGSARDYIADQAHGDTFYAWTFTRTNAVAGPHVTILPSTSLDFSARYGTNTPVDMRTLRVIARAYLEPATKTRPTGSELLFDRLLLFTPKTS